MKPNGNLLARTALALLLALAPAASLAQDRDDRKAKPGTDAAKTKADDAPKTKAADATKADDGAKASDAPPAAHAPATQQPTPSRAPDRLEPDDKRPQPSDVPAQMQANRREQLTEEEAAVVPYYNNFMATYRLGPEDVISIRVFNEDRYSLGNITIPPNGRISYWFVPEGLMVTGKTPEQVAADITRHLDEYLIEPKVTVSLERAMSARYSVIGDVAQPGIRVMTRRLTVYEALAEAGGILQTGDKKKVTVLRQKADGTLEQRLVDVAAIEKGRALNNEFLAPGDQVVVPGNRFKTVQKIMTLLPVLGFARIFTGGW
ncbi:MAG TPA: polysaccharide biosynthesis/export family protein [Pyrinomonadaceae bacterium]|nr:polysaccharide biosynthesis/export family protein [Pyrinomonadaceae bacterium]